MDNDDQKISNLLNPHQKRSLLVALYQLERSFRDTNDWLSEKSVEGILYKQRLSLSNDSRVEGQRVIGQGLDLISKLANRLEFEKYDENLSATINSLLHVQWINLHDQYAAKQKRSGDVNPELSKNLDPLIDELIATVLKLQEVLEKDKKSS